MPNKLKDKYDAVIIGAGISGLVCGCYLAKHGMKTLIVEKNDKPGGYCTSFTRDGFTFDACVHSLGSLKENKNLIKVLRELDIYKRMQIKRIDPSDSIITLDYRIHFWNELNKTIQGFQDNFPKEANQIKSFFNFITKSKPMSFTKTDRDTFKDLLDHFFGDTKLKAILSLPVLGNIGLPPSLISVFTGSMLYREFMLDSGYYPKDGIHALPDMLATRFKEFGGDLLLSHAAKRITLKNNKIKGVMLNENNSIETDYVISNCDTRQTFNKLLYKETVDKKIIDKIDNMTPSLSAFLVYLAVKKEFRQSIEKQTNLWFLPNYNIEDNYSLINQGEIDSNKVYLLSFIRDSNVCLFTNAPFRDRKYWESNRDRIADNLIKKVENIIPGLSKYIIFKENATPSTLNRRTLNYQGAAYGWASLYSQFAIPGLSQVTPIQNLYLTGHWTTLASGVPGVAYLGRDTAKIILKKEEKDV